MIEAAGSVRRAARFREARAEITGDSWLDDLARASLSAAEAKSLGETVIIARTVPYACCQHCPAHRHAAHADPCRQGCPA
jgi:hypothetical protein